MTSIAASLIPTSPTELVFGQNETVGDGGGKDGGGTGSKGGGNGGESGNSTDNKGPIQPKEFFWDQFLIYISTIVALLTVLDITLQFFRGGGLVCRLPSTVLVGNVTAEVTRDEATYVNTFCQQSLSIAEYYPLFVLIQGLVLAAPQYLWASLFVGQFDFFFGLVKQLDRLRSSETGEYQTKNFEIVNKLEKQFPRKWKWISIFSFYIAKLILQLLVVLTSLVINGTVFQTKHFDFSFDCPKHLNTTSPPKGWWLPFQVTCVFSSFRLHLQLQKVDYFLLCLAIVAIVYGLFWCAKRHVNALGFREAALFAFSSCLRPSEYVEEHFFKTLLKPGVRNDLDFLLMRLFRADSGHGLVFKDIQVEKELKKREERDHELLHLYVEATKDSCKTRTLDLRQTFKDAGFDCDPEHEVFNQLNENALGNINWEYIQTPTIRNIIFGFLQFLDKNDFAMDISFGSSGYSLILARAFKDVLSLNFHSFYSNESEICHLEHFHADYSTLRFQENILTKGTAKLNKLEEAISTEFEGHFPDNPDLEKQLNFVLVGPFTDNAKIATVNLFLERQKNAYRYAKHCLLMYMRPVRIGPQRVDKRFCTYTPPSDYFQKSHHSQNLKEKQFEETLKEKMNSSSNFNDVIISINTTVNGEHMIFANVQCYQTKCQFEITLFEYKGDTVRPANIPVPYCPLEDQTPSNAVGNIALIIPSQILPQLERDNIQRFMDGNMAIKLQARLPGSPIQFILPSNGCQAVVPDTNGHQVT